MKCPLIIPDHTLLRPIGRGAYGEVWLARNVMGTLRAVKIIWRRDFESDRPYEREFAGVQRYEPVSRCTDGLVHVLHVGRNDEAGCFYYVMELADAATGGGPDAGSRGTAEEDGSRSMTVDPDYSPRTLRSEIQRLGRLPTAACLRVGMEVAGGLSLLHRQGLVHRDVKPGNIIFVNGQAKLADIGLISARDEGRTFVGTEGYIPPEGPGTAQSDIYALGIALYEASTGFQPDRLPDVPIEWFKEGEGDESLELHEVILRCCEADRDRRYRTAGQLRADLALIESGQSVRRVRALERRVRWARATGVVATLLAVLATAGVLMTGWRARMARLAEQRESALRVRAEAAEREAHDRLHGAYLAEARLAVQSANAGRRFKTLETLRQAGAIRVTPAVRQTALAALALPDLRILQRSSLGADVSSHAFNSDFSRYALARGKGPVEISAAGGSNLLFSLPPATNLNARMLRFSPDDRYLAFKRDHGSGADAALEVWDLACTQRVFYAPHSVAYGAVDFHPREARLLVVQPGGKAMALDLTGGPASTLWPKSPARSLSHAPDGGRVALAGPDYVGVRDASTGDILARVALSNHVNEVAWQPQGHWIAAVTDEGSVVLIDTTNYAARTLGQHKAQAVGVTFTPDGEFVITRGWDREINVWHVRSARREVTLFLRASSFQMDRAGRRLAVEDAPGNLTLLEFMPGKECRQFSTALAGVPRTARFSPDYHWLALMTTEALTVWDLIQPGPPARADKRELTPLGFSADSSELFAWIGEHQVRQRVREGIPGGPPRLEPLPLFHRGQESVSASPSTDPETPLAIWQRGQAGLQTVSMTNMNTGQGGVLTGTDWEGAISPDGRWMARRAGSTVLTLTPLKTPGPSVRLTNTARVRFQAFSPDGASLAVLTDEGLQLLDTQTWERKRNLAGEAAATSHLAYSTDGRLLACAWSSRSGVILDAGTLELLLPLPEGMHPLGFSPDGRWLLVIADGRQVQLWDFAAVRERFRELGIDWP